MVLWEITLGTAYFLGLKRTYKLALRIQRRLVGPKRPKIRQFLHRKTRTIFDVALKVHREVQQRDIEVGRNLGNWILRWLDKMKPAAQIRSHPPHHSHSNIKNNHNNNNKKINNNHSKNYSTISCHQKQEYPQRHSAYPTIMRAPLGITTQYRRFQLDGVIRNDIKQWMINNY
ncbi:hypothetical protein LXL04_029899 [Taraxacum kok-saghyz]